MGSSADASSVASFVLFLDENHCENPHLRRVLVEANVTFERHLVHFPPGTQDVDWLPVVGRRGWAVLTTDKRMRRRPLEREAIRDCMVRMSYFANNDTGGADMAESLRKALPKVRRLALEQAPPFTASITRGGDVHLRDLF